MERQSYDVVLMDVHMPEMDGLRATRAIRARTASVPQPWIIAMTADVLTDHRRVPRAVWMILSASRCVSTNWPPSWPPSR
ncbi:MAG: response regulator [Caldilineaceae bacterium]